VVFIELTFVSFRCAPAIAKAAGVSTIGTYSHFDGKQGIVDALYTEGFAAVDRAMSVSDLGLSLSPVDFILRAATNYLELAESRRAHCKLIFGESDSSYMPGPEARHSCLEAHH
jgi:AcrR family transcriptional regulator